MKAEQVSGNKASGVNLTSLVGGSEDRGYIKSESAIANCTSDYKDGRWTLTSCD